MNKKLIILPSQCMDSNKKPSRNEAGLLRMPKVARKKLKVGNTVPINSKLKLKTFHAFKDDINVVKNLISEGTLKPSDLEHVGFVTSSTFKKLSNGSGAKTIIEVNLDDIQKTFLIGTDPEMLLFDNNEIVHACHIYGLTKEAKFGADGAMAELRPDPAKTPDEIVNNILDVFRQAPNSVKNLKWVAECYWENDSRDYPVGSHIHFDNPFDINNLNDTQKNRLFAVTNKILDELLTLPMVRLDGDKGRRRRAKCKMSAASGFGSTYGLGYGFFGEWRGTKGRLEYRSLSGLMLADPDLCENVFGTAKAIVEAVYNDAIDNGLDPEYILPGSYNKSSIYNKSFDEWYNIPIAERFGCIKSSNDMIFLMHNSSRSDINKSFIKKWRMKMRHIPTYSKYEKYVEGLGSLLSCNVTTIDNIDTNIKQNWRV